MAGRIDYREYHGDEEEERSEVGTGEPKLYMPTGVLRGLAYLHATAINVRKHSPEVREEASYNLIQKAIETAKTYRYAKSLPGKLSRNDLENALKSEKMFLRLTDLRTWRGYLRTNIRKMPIDKAFRCECERILDFKPFGIATELTFIRLEEYRAIKAALEREYTLLEGELMTHVVDSLFKKLPSWRDDVFPYLTELSKDEIRHGGLLGRGIFPPP
jgi:hypothetical protein